MDALEEEKRRIKERRQNTLNYHPEKNQNINSSKRYVDNLIARLLIGLITFFGLIILTNFNSTINSYIKERVLKDNISFTKISNLYNKYLGNIVPLQNVNNDEKTVFNEKIAYESIKNYKDGYELTVSDNYLVPVINSGIIVFIGEKEELGNTVIIQGIDEIDYWYSNVDNLSANLYDYVSKGDYLGISSGNKMYLTFKKGNDYLEFDEVIK